MLGAGGAAACAHAAHKPHSDLMNDLLTALGPQALPDADIETRMSLLQRQMKIGDACTFRLIAKNVVSLLPASQEDLKEQTMTELENLIRCASRRWGGRAGLHRILGAFRCPAGITTWEMVDTPYMPTALEGRRVAVALAACGSLWTLATNPERREGRTGRTTCWTTTWTARAWATRTPPRTCRPRCSTRWPPRTALAPPSSAAWGCRPATLPRSRH